MYKPICNIILLYRKIILHIGLLFYYPYNGKLIINLTIIIQLTRAMLYHTYRYYPLLQAHG